MKFVIPGAPVAQGRPRFSRRSRGLLVEHPRAIDPAASRAWKKKAAQWMWQSLEDRSRVPFPDGPLLVEVVAVFPCPKGDHRKRTPAPRRPHSTKPDAENVAKAVLDAAKGIVFTDDAQVSRLVVEKVIGAQGEAPYVEITVRALGFMEATWAQPAKQPELFP